MNDTRYHVAGDVTSGEGRRRQIGILLFNGVEELVKEWTAFNGRPVERVARAFGEIRSGGTFDLTTLSVAQRQLRNLVLTSSPCR